MRLKLLLLVSMVLLSFPVYSADKACEKAIGKNALLEINKNMLKTIDNMAPIKIGSTELVQGDDLPTVDSVEQENICWCKRGAVELPGIAMSFWNSVGLVETTAIPYCFPSLSTSIGLGFGADKSYGQRNTGKTGKNKMSSQTHFMTMNILGLVNAGLSALCLSMNGVAPSTGVDHISELYPWWQNDIWAVIFAPDSLLVANPIAQAACYADSVASVINKPLDFLYWCYGTWGGSYPNTITIGSGDAISSYALLASRTVASMYKTTQLALTAGKHMYTGACQPIPTILMKKSVVNIYPIFPILQTKRQSIGASNFQWGFGQDMPFKNNGVIVWGIYQKRDCCAL